VYIDSKDPYRDIYGSQKILHKNSNPFKATTLLQKCVEEGSRGRQCQGGWSGQRHRGGIEEGSWGSGIEVGNRGSVVGAATSKRAVGPVVLGWRWPGAAASMRAARADGIKEA
jgi:hypothetical protein